MLKEMQMSSPWLSHVPYSMLDGVYLHSLFAQAARLSEQDYERVGVDLLFRITTLNLNNQNIKFKQLMHG